MMQQAYKSNMEITLCNHISKLTDNCCELQMKEMESIQKNNSQRVNFHKAKQDT